MPTKRFGKYRTRQKIKRSKPEKKGGAIADEIKETVAPVQRTIQKMDKPLVMRNIFDYDFDNIKGVAYGGSLHPHMDKMHFGISDYGYNHIKDAANHILGRATKIIHSHHHNVTAERHKIHKIAESSKAQLRQHLRNPDMHKAISDVMHVAEKGGAISFRHELGGGITTEDLKNVAETVRKANDPLEEAVKVKSSYDKVNFDDHSTRGLARNAVTGLAGNFHVASTHMKTANTFIPGAAAFLEPGAQGFSAVGTGLDKIYSLI